MSGILYFPLKEFFETDTLRHRETAIAIGEMATGIGTIALDFNGIFFVSNAFFSELLRVAEKYRIQILNASPNVLNMLKATSRRLLEVSSDTNNALYRINSITVICDGKEFNILLNNRK